MKKEKLYFVDLFAGCGGLSLGLELAGFEPIFVNELNNDAMETYLINREDKHPHLRDHRYHVHDVKALIANKDKALKVLMRDWVSDFGVNAREGDIDLLVGGPPCQGYSGIGHRRSYAVDKEQLPSNYLYEDMAHIVYKLKPKIFLFENVKGLMTAKWTSSGVKGEIWENVKQTFKKIPDYKVRPELVYAKDYGVPQNRPRVLIIGVRNDVRVEMTPGLPADGLLPNPTNNYPHIREILGDLVDRNYTNGGSTPRYPSEATNNIQKWFRRSPETGRVAAKGAPLTEHEYSHHRENIVKKFQYMVDNGGEIPPPMQTKKFAQRVLPSRWDESGPSITATSLPDDYVHYKQPRTLTVREWARIQTFPDWYQFAGKRTTGGIRRAGNPREGIFDREVPKYTQIGNAVPVLLAKAVGEHFRKILQSS